MNLKSSVKPIVSPDNSNKKHSTDNEPEEYTLSSNAVATTQVVTKTIANAEGKTTTIVTTNKSKLKKPTGHPFLATKGLLRPVQKIQGHSRKRMEYSSKIL